MTAEMLARCARCGGGAPRDVPWLHALETALASDGEENSEEDEQPVKKPKTPPSSGKKKGPSPRMTRSRAKVKQADEPPAKRRR